jgi:hypothetical protein
MPVAFTERRWPLLERMMDLGRLRAREVLLGESHPATEWKARGTAPTAILAKLRKPWKNVAAMKGLVAGADVPD